MKTKALIIAEHANQQLQSSTSSLVTAASQMADEVHILLMGSQLQSVVEQAAELQGVMEVKYCQSAELDQPSAEKITSQIMAVVEDYAVVLTAASTFGKNFMPCVAALLDVAQISEVIQVESRDTFVRPIYAGNALATVRSLDPIKVLTIRPAGFEAAPLGGGATITEIPLVVPEISSKFLGASLSKNERPELGAARIVVSGGRGLGSAENFSLLEKLADKLGAAIGASRAAVDAGYVSNALQVGQTGKIVAPELYFAIGISGAIQHLAGMKDSKVIVAINKDAEAPIFEIADYGLVADLFEVLPVLAEKL